MNSEPNDRREMKIILLKKMQIRERMKLQKIALRGLILLMLLLLIGAQALIGVKISISAISFWELNFYIVLFTLFALMTSTTITRIAEQGSFIPSRELDDQEPPSMINW